MADMEKVIKLCAGARGWRRKLLVSATKEPRALLANVLLALREAPEWKGVLAYDAFALTALALRPPPWVGYPASGHPCAGLTGMTSWLQSGYSAKA